MITGGSDVVGTIRATVDWKGKGKATPPKGQMVLTGGLFAWHNAAAEEEEYVFEEDEEAMQMNHRWMAVARYYSGQEYSTWGLFLEVSKAWGWKEPVLMR